jgi:hypothetical protein
LGTSAGACRDIGRRSRRFDHCVPHDALPHSQPDYATTSCACGDFDPLQACVEACVDYLVHDRWLVRRLPRLVRAAGFDFGRFRSHSYVEAPCSDGYMLAIVDRGADVLLASGRITREAADALKAEARRRSDAGEFFGHIVYAILIARKPSMAPGMAGTDVLQR